MNLAHKLLPLLMPQSQLVAGDTAPGKTLNKTFLQLTTVSLLVTLSGSVGWFIARHDVGDQLSSIQSEPILNDDGRKVLYWYDPMMPQQHFDHPGKSPFMDMQLVAKYAIPNQDKPAEAATGVAIDPQVTKNIGVRLAPVSHVSLSRQIEVSGLISFNERDTAVVQSRNSGFVERVWPLAIGDIVKAGQPLAEVLVPEWAAAQQELLAVRKFADPALLAAARDRLQLLGMSKTLIAQLERTGVVQSRYTISAPIAGVIQSVDVRNGMTVTNGQTLAHINGLSNVWLDVAVPEAQSDAIRVGNSAQVRLTAAPDRAINGSVTTILPALNEASRSVRVRVELKNPDNQLRPGLSAQVTLNSSAKASTLGVPTEALIRTGKRTLVIVADAQGRFSPQEIIAGHEIGDQTLISSGLTEGQQVVASGQFLIDSEASLNGIEAHWSSPAQQEVLEHSHEDAATTKLISADSAL